MAHIQILAQDKNNKAEVKQLTDALGRMMNEVKAVNQRAAEAQQQQAPNGNGHQLDPETAAKLKGSLVLAEAKAANATASHAQKMMMKQQAHDQQLRDRAADAETERNLQIKQAEADVAATDLKTAGEIRRDGQRASKEEASAAE
jgi:hypothetical protein